MKTLEKTSLRRFPVGSRTSVLLFDPAYRNTGYASVTLPGNCIVSAKTVSNPYPTKPPDQFVKGCKFWESQMKEIFKRYIPDVVIFELPIAVPGKVNQSLMSAGVVIGEILSNVPKKALVYQYTVPHIRKTVLGEKNKGLPANQRKQAVYEEVVRFFETKFLRRGFKRRKTKNAYDVTDALALYLCWLRENAVGRNICPVVK